MKRIERVHQLLADNQTDFTTQTVADRLAITRANASYDLNQLVQAGKVTKSGGRPVLYRVNVNEQAEDLFSVFVRKNPSLKNSLELAQAAVLYPVGRMHILLTGETGTGKSLLAKMIYEFSQEQQIIEQTAPFIVFNCADYANTPQLLTSQLFGVQKGAYTGADKDQMGLLEQADGGVLFLDEVHRLPPEAQEILFRYIDNGTFRRLGETNGERCVDVQLICATTEEVDSALLHTFSRRIPIKIVLPNLAARSIKERLQLIYAFFRMEAKNIGLDLHVSLNVIRALLGYNCPNNIGQLKADIQLICAKAYAVLVTMKAEEFTLMSGELPEYIHHGLYANNERRREIWSLTDGVTERAIVFSGVDTPIVLENDQEVTDIYQLLDSKMHDMKLLGMNNADMLNITEQTIQDYFSHLSQKQHDVKSNIVNIVGLEVFEVSAELIKQAAEKFQQSFDDNIVAGLALHLYSTTRHLKNGEHIFNPQLAEIQEKYASEYQFVRKAATWMGKKLGIHLPKDELGYISLFLNNRFNLYQKRQVNVVVIAHGESTATSMANVANELLQSKNAIGFNMPLDCEPRQVLQQVFRYLQQQSAKLDVILLVDMGSLVNFKYELTKSFGIQVEVISLASTLHVIEALRKAEMGESVTEIALALKQIHETDELTVKEKEEKSAEKRPIIVTMCTTGERSAVLIKEMLQTRLNLHDGFAVVKNIQVSNQQEAVKQIVELQQYGEIICAIGAFTLHGVDYPQFDIQEIWQEEFMEHLQEQLDFSYACSEVRQNLLPMLENIGAMTFSLLEKWVKEIGSRYKIINERKVGLLCHLLATVDKLPSSAASILQQNADEFDHEIYLLEEMVNVQFEPKERNLLHSYFYGK